MRVCGPGNFIPYIDVMKANLYNYFGKLVISIKVKHAYLIIQQIHVYVYIQNKLQQMTEGQLQECS